MMFEKWVEVGEEIDVRGGAQIGVEGFEVRREEMTPKFIKHFGRVRIGNNCTIGANSVICRGLKKDDITQIGCDCHIDNLVYISHNVQIGKRVIICAGTFISGSVIIEEDVFIGVGVRIAPNIRIGKKCKIGIGSVVVRDIPIRTFVLGNPARAISKNDFWKEQ